jgi:hypothetical protein
MFIDPPSPGNPVSLSLPLLSVTQPAMPNKKKPFLSLSDNPALFTSFSLQSRWVKIRATEFSSKQIGCQYILNFRHKMNHLLVSVIHAMFVYLKFKSNWTPSIFSGIQTKETRAFNLLNYKGQDH